YALAVRLVGRGAYLMGESVLELYDLALVNPAHVTVGTPHRTWKALPTWVRVVQRKLPPEVLRVEDGIAQTTVALAIVDCMDTVMSDRLRDAISAAGRRSLLTARERDALRARLARRRNRTTR
ncbi:MAG: type IV toxin-antitoxin system AbiEi family antitoxin domain-containing protein, partial [Dermatophilaceae bacterium]